MRVVCSGDDMPGSGLCGKLKRLKLYRISAEDVVAGLHEASPMTIDRPFIQRLRQDGQAAAETWLAGEDETAPSLVDLASALAPPSLDGEWAQAGASGTSAP